MFQKQKEKIVSFFTLKSLTSSSKKLLEMWNLLKTPNSQLIWIIIILDGFNWRKFTGIQLKNWTTVSKKAKKLSQTQYKFL